MKQGTVIALTAALIVVVLRVTARTDAAFAAAGSQQRGVSA